MIISTLYANSFSEEPHKILTTIVLDRDEMDELVRQAFLATDPDPSRERTLIMWGPDPDQLLDRMGDIIKEHIPEIEEFVIDWRQTDGS